MNLLLAAAKRDLLRLLLEAHERSSCYGRPGPWPRDLIVRIDAKTFPTAFDAEGREEMDALRMAATELESAGAVRLIRHRGPLEGEPREVRVGPSQIDRAAAVAAEVGFELLEQGLRAVADCASSLGHSETLGWWSTYLQSVKEGLDRADPGALGMSRLRFKKEWRDLLAALQAATVIAKGVSGWERIVSVQIFGLSKTLGRLRSQVTALLLRADPRWQGVPLDDASELLESYGVRRKPGLIRCAGVGALSISGRIYRLEDFRPTAHLPDEWRNAWADALVATGAQVVTTIENEFPFLSYVEESGGPEGLGLRGEVAIYTAGFPTPALMDALRSVSGRLPGASFRHWGDADVGGLRIWWFIRQALTRPVSIFRTTAAWVESADGGPQLREEEVNALTRLAGLVAAASPAGPDQEQVRALIATMLDRGIKLEQERY